MIKFVKFGQMNDGGYCFTIGAAGDLGAPHRQAIGEIDGTIDRVDNKTIIGNLTIFIEFFADYVVIWVVLFDLINKVFFNF